MPVAAFTPLASHSAFPFSAVQYSSTMPQLIVKTNISKCKVPKDFFAKSTQIVANMLDKPAAGTTVVVDADAALTVGGTQEPAALVWLQSIGCISRAENKQWTAQLYPHLQSSLGIPGDRIFLRFIDISRDDLAWNGKTFDDILPPPE